MQKLSKSKILAHRQCPRRLWLQIHHPELEAEDTGRESLLSMGNQIGTIARNLHPGGVLIDAEDLKEALDDTARLLREKPKPLFEATFQTDGVLVRADLLLPDDGKSWRVTEVKSASKIKEYHLDDAAIQSWVTRQAGVKISRIEIAHIDTSFDYPGDDDYRGLLTHTDVTHEIIDLEAEVPGWIAAARETIVSTDPETASGDHCHDPFECPFFNHCNPDDSEDEGYPPEILPRAKALAIQLRTEGCTDIRDIPKGRLTNPQHVLIWEATRRKRPILNPEAGDLLQNLGWPRYYLDFETIQFPIPIWPGTRPYAQIPFQWSCHIESTNGKITHQEFLADGTDDPSRTFAETLIAALRSRGPILVYNAGFERSRMKELAARFPELAPALNTAIERIVDLLPIAREHYYHPEMHGSWSIKAVLPTIAPELAYDDLNVADGGMAQEAFAEMMKPQTSLERKAELRDGLLKYCERDTWAMVRVAHHFQGITNAK